MQRQSLHQAFFRGGLVLLRLKGILHDPPLPQVEWKFLYLAVSQIRDVRDPLPSEPFRCVTQFKKDVRIRRGLRRCGSDDDRNVADKHIRVVDLGENRLRNVGSARLPLRVPIQAGNELDILRRDSTDRFDNTLLDEVEIA